MLNNTEFTETPHVDLRSGGGCALLNHYRQSQPVPEQWLQRRKKETSMKGGNNIYSSFNPKFPVCNFVQVIACTRTHNALQREVCISSMYGGTSLFAKGRYVTSSSPPYRDGGLHKWNCTKQQCYIVGIRMNAALPGHEHFYSGVLSYMRSLGLLCVLPFLPIANSCPGFGDKEKGDTRWRPP